MRRPPYPLPDWWFDESSIASVQLLREINRATTARWIAEAYTGVGAVRAERVLRRRPWDGYVSLVELLQIDGIGAFILATMLEEALRRSDLPRSQHPPLLKRIAEVRDRLHRPDGSNERSFLDEDELLQLLLWTEGERNAVLAYANQVRTGTLRNVRGFTTRYSNIASRVVRAAPYNDLYELASFLGIGVGRMRNLRLGMLEDPDFVPVDLPGVLLPVRIETKYGPGTLRIRVYPDGLHLEEHQTGLVRFGGEGDEDEVVLAEAFWRHAAAKSYAGDAMRVAFERVANAVGSSRAAYVLTAHQPESFRAATLTFPKPLPAGDTVVTVFGLPEFFRFEAVHPDGQTESAFGEPVSRNLVFGVPTLEGADATLDWLTDFDAAVAAGMAITLPWDHSEGPAMVKVFGLSALENGETLGRHLREKAWVRPMAFVAPGTPTNHTETAASTFTEARVREARFQDVVAVLKQGPAPGGPRRLGRWLGTDLEGILAPVEALGPLHREILGAVFDGLFWPAIENVVGPDAVPVRGEVRRWFLNRVRADGPVAPVRVGRVPFGVLPLMSESVSLDAVGEGVKRVVDGLRGRWLSQVRPPQDEDPATGVLLALAQAAHPTAWAERAWLPGDAGEVIAEVRRLLSRLPSRSESHPVAWDRSLGAFVAGIETVLDWAEDRTGARPSLFSSPSEALSPRNAQSERARLTGLATANLALAVGVCRDRHVPEVWTSTSQWWTTEGVADRRNGVDEAKYKPWGTNASAREANEERARDWVGALADWGRQYRTWEAWDEALSTMSQILDLLDREFYRQGSRQDEVLELLFDVWGPGIGGGAFGDATPGVETDPSGAPATTLSLGYWVDVPEGGEGQPLLHRLVGDDRAAELLASGDPERLEWIVRGAVGVAGYRLDAWMMGVASAQIDAFRDAQAEGEAPPGSVRVGAYGVVLDLPSRAARPRASEGHVLAPSLRHATTAAVLRSGWLGHDPMDVDQPLAVHLEGGRTQTALDLLAAVRDGDALGARVGWMCEKVLSDAGRGAWIGPLREAIAGSTDGVVDGLAALDLMDRIRLAEGSEEDDEGMLPVLDSAMVGLLAPVGDAVDAVHDLLLAEGVHQLLRRSPERAQVALDALTPGLGRPPEEFEVLEASGVARQEAFRFVLAAPAPATPGPQPRATAAPALNAYVESVLGPLASLNVMVEGAGAVSLQTLGVCGLDAVFEGDGLLVRAAEHLGWEGELAWADTPDTHWRLLARDLLAVVTALKGVEEDVSSEAVRVHALADAFVLAAGVEDAVLGRALLPWRSTAARAAALERAGRADSPAHQDFVEAVRAESARIGTLRAQSDSESVTALMQLLVGLPVGVAGSRDWVETTEVPAVAMWARVRAGVEAYHQAALTADLLDHPVRAVRVFEDGDNRVVLDGPPDGVAWVLDRWTESVPDAEATLGVALHADAPGAMPPAAWVVTLPPEAGWTVDAVGQTVDQVVQWMRIRSVGPRALGKHAELGVSTGAVPLLMEAP